MSSWLHRVLGLQAATSDESIRTAYRSLLKLYHPDLCANTDENRRRLKLVRLAYEVLQDPELSQEHEKTGEIPRGVNLDPELQEWLKQTGLQHVAKGFFKGFKMARPEHGRTFKKNVTLSVQELMHGSSRIVDVQRTVSCTQCTGSGSSPSPPPVRCHVCAGAGTLSWKKKWNVAMPCPFCAGDGMIIRVTCPECEGQGFATVNEMVRIQFFAGIREDTEIVLKGEGERGKRGGKHGDLIFVAKMEQGSGFERIGDDLELGVTIPNNAKSISVPHPDGDLRITVPQGKDTIVIVREKGLPNADNSDVRGDLRVRLRRGED
jgi:molecular chaperone DnaJ